MRQLQRQSRVGCIAAAFLFAVIVSGITPDGDARAQGTADRILQSATAERGAEGWELHLRFSIQLRYVRHSPRAATSVGLIELETIGITRADESTPVARETLRPFDRQGPPVIELVTEQTDTGDRAIELHFRVPTKFEVTQGPNLQELTITLPAETDTGPEGRAKKLLISAGEAMRLGDYRRAISLYTKVLSLEAPSSHEEARERIGLAYERNGQRAHAQAEYEKYLELHPEGSAARRVRQRLSALSTAGQPEPEERRAPRRAVPTRYRKDFHGSLSAFYSRDKIFFEEGPDGEKEKPRLFDHSTSLDLYLTGRLRGPRWEFEATGSGRTRVDFITKKFGEDSRLTSALLEASERGDGWWSNLGRQRGGGGVIGRFDGGRIGYRPNDSLDFQVLWGFPLEDFSSNKLNTDRIQVGVVSQVLQIGELVDVELYTNYQNEDSLTYRAALGGQARHLRAERSIVGSLDYDPYFNVLNIASLLADVEVAPRLRLNTLIEYRASPFVTLGNALIAGPRLSPLDRPSKNIHQLRRVFSDSEIKELALDRTAFTTTFTVGSRYDLTDRFDLLGTFTASRRSSTSGTRIDGGNGVLGTESVGYQYTYYAQVNGKALLMDRGLSTASIRIFDGAGFDSYTFQLNGRYPVIRKLRLNPMFRLEVQNQRSNSETIRVEPRLRLDYTWEGLIFDLDFSYEFRHITGNTMRPDEHGYSLLAGLRYSF